MDMIFRAQFETQAGFETAQTAWVPKFFFLYIHSA